MNGLNTRRIFMGQLPRHTRDFHVKIVLDSYHFSSRVVKMGTGYAFVDIEDRQGRDEETLLQVLKSIHVDGQSVKVEFCSSGPRSYGSDRRVNNNKVVVHNLPDSLSLQDVKAFLSDVSNGTINVKQCDRANNKTLSKASYIVHLNTPEEAQIVLNSVTGVVYGDATLKVVPFAENHGGRYKYRSNSVSDISHAAPNSPVYPFRFLVPTHMIGGIIGVNGATIKKFQIESGARYIIVDVQQKDERFPDEKPVTVLGSAESQISAMDKILKFLDDLIVSRWCSKEELTTKSNTCVKSSSANVLNGHAENGSHSLVNGTHDEERSECLSNGNAETGAIQSQANNLQIPDVISDSLAATSNEAASQDHRSSNSPSLDSGIKSESSENGSSELQSQEVPKETKSSASTKSTASPVEFGTMTEFRVPLTVKILTHDHLIGRLIGRGGSNLAEIKKSTETRITIPNSAPGSGCNGSGFHCESNEGATEMERIITIDGERSKTTQAARAMLIKLRASYDRDVDHIMKQQANMQSLYPTNGWSHFGNPFMGAAPPPSYAHQFLTSQAVAPTDPFTLARLGAALPSTYQTIPSMLGGHGGAQFMPQSQVNASFGTGQLNVPPLPVPPIFFEQMQGQESAQKKIRSIVQKGKASPGLSGFLPGFGDPHVNAFPNMGTPVTPKSPATIAASGSFINAAVKMAGGMSLGASAAPGAPTMSAASAQQLVATLNNCVAANSNASLSNHANTIASPVINVSAAFGQF
ncbi:insulin-like growth factor 2 mRNA-binding protein 1 isoform X2 [Symsagittifera roscoffensis]|uniref:insulin-like growth factor 2 mRNA-binding protein 1 isoform X2 n=1 Tax=Symsagittifera roscoffensis TaxID=84072 RepID=UPI00307BE85C